MMLFYIYYRCIYFWNFDSITHGMRLVCQIAKLKLALDEKEREAGQFKDLANRVTSEMRNARTRSPLTTSMSLKPEAGQESSVDTCTSEVLCFFP